MQIVRIHNAPVISGAGRGKGLGIPTINIDLSSIPKDVAHGIYACWITINGKKYRGAMHYGPRPVFKDSTTFEVHIIDDSISEVPDTVDIEIVEYIRQVQNFPNPEALVKRIQKDIEEARGMLLP